MSSTWRTVASAQPLPASSGMYFVTSAFASSLPSATSIAPSVPNIDLVTDIAICGECGVMTPR